ncbi:MAG: hypothetical protein K2P94_15420 [Rhodospirillaceae bacterium]|nr:hypothetical protein [Rhodospirillaceae bacterium]
MTSPAISLKPTVEPKKAVARFLKDMAAVAKRSFPAWQKTLTAGIEDCPLNYDQRRGIFEIHPLDDYYFAGVVALEAAKIRALFAPDEASELLSQLAEQIDTAAERTDRTVSDFAFFIISRIELVGGIDKSKMPYDQVVKVILQRLGVDKIEATQHLMTQTLYRHTLGEPLALGVPQWWKAFRAKYSLDGDIAHAPKEIRIESAKPAKPSPPPKIPRRAVAFN